MVSVIPEAQTNDRLLSTLEQLLEIDAAALGPALDRASQLVAEALGADKVDAFVYQPEIDSLVALGNSDTPMARRQLALGLDRLPLANGGRSVLAFRSDTSFLSPKTDQDPEELKGIVEGLGARSALIVQLHLPDGERGVLEAFSGASDFFTPRDLRFLEAVSRWVAMVARRASLAEQGTRDAEVRGRRLAAEELSRLTRRELEIAALVADGLSNEEIAERLVLAPGTVANHMRNILFKLEMSNRVQLAVWVVEHGVPRDGIQDRSDGARP